MFGALELAHRRLVPCLLSILALLALAFAPTAQAQAILDESSKTAGGLLVYVGLLPAQILKARGMVGDEGQMRQMHGGAPSGKHEYHLTVAIFDSKTGERVTDANVKARLSSVGLAGPRKQLEPMQMGDVTTYGEFFDLSGADRYTIALEIERPGARTPVKLDFAFRHYSPLSGEQP